MESSLVVETLDRQSAMAAVTSNNVYVHSSPPKAISGQGVAIRQWVRAGDVDKLEQVVLDGQGARLLGLIDSTADTKVKAFLRSVPAYMAKVDLIHDAVIRGSLREIQALLDKRKLATGRDAVGRGLLHKAVLYNHKSVIEWLGKKYPETLQIKDNEGRTALHYTPAAKDPDELFSQLISLGAKESVDIHGRKPSYYINHPENLDIEGPRSLSNNRNSKRPRLESNPVTKPISSTITRAQIRIWIHERDVGKLEKIVWSGHGDKLLLETTNNAKVKKFLLNVPHLLSRIKSIHSSAINNDVETIKEVRSKTEIPEVFTAKDSHGLTAMHKAAGLAHRTVVEWFLFEFPNQLLNDQDNEGRTPLHYAAKDNSTYNFLLKAGANETILDSKGKSPLYYKRNVGELDGRHLRNVPDAPRVTGELTPWDRVVTSPGGILDPKRRISNGEFNHDEDPSPPPRITPEVENKTQKPSSTSHLNNYDSDGYNADTEGKYDIPDDIGIDNFDVDVAAGDLNQTQSNSNNDNYDLDDDFEPPIPDTDANEQPIRFFDGRQTTPEDDVEDLTPPPTRDESPVKYEKPEEQETEPINNADFAKSSDERNPDPEPEAEPEPEQEPEKAIEKEPEPESVPEPEPEPEPEHEMEGANDVEEEEVKPVTETDETAPETENITDGDVEFNEEPEPGGITDEHMEEDNLIDDFEDMGDNFEESINTEDMEKLVELVLNGKGNELLNMKSRNPEVQEFITNIPAYMAKIASIHAAAASGNLRDLQTILDRKRLALAKDSNGLVPLHKAVLNSHSKVIRYLASNYNQSINATDNNGRTPLHYAATLADSGATYKSLIAAGADPNIKDGNGNTPGIYLRNKDLLSHADLTRAASNNVMVPSAVLRKHAETWQRPPSGKPGTAADKDTTAFSDSDTTQLQHLQLIEIAHTNPVKISQRTLEMLKEAYKNLITEESIWARIMNRLTNNNSSQCISKEYIQQYMTPQVFSLLSNRTTFYGATLLDVIKFYPQAFIIAPDPHAYVVYKELFHPVIMDHAKFYCTIHPKLFINGDNNQFPAIWSDEGKYLASVLGDALVKGLTQVSQERPDDPVEYLANFLRRYGQDSRSAHEHEDAHKRIDSPAIQDSAIAQAAAAATVTSVAIHNHIQRNPSLEEVAEMTEEPTTDEPENENSSTEAATEDVEESEQTVATTQDEELPGEVEVEGDNDKADDEAEIEANNDEAKEDEAEDEAENVNKDEGDAENPDEEEQGAMETEETNATSGQDAEAEEEPKVESQTEVESPTEVEPETSEAEAEDEDAAMLRRLDDEVTDQNPDDEDEDAIQVQPEEKEEDVEGTGQRDERGQSVLHFAAARPGGAQTLLSFLHNPVVNLAWRDERFKTARDVASSLHRTENIQAIDSYIISRALGGDVETLEKLMLDGYDHITASEDEKQNSIMDLTEKAGQTEVIKFLKSVPEYQEKLDNLMDAIRLGDLDRVKQSLEDDPRLAIAVGKHGRTPLHVAVLCEEYSIVQYIAQQFPQALRRGDNLERTALHYAMGIEKVEKMTRILVRMGAKRVLKDIKGRQPSYYFINREEIAILQEEEKTS